MAYLILKRLGFEQVELSEVIGTILLHPFLKLEAMQAQSGSKLLTNYYKIKCKLINVFATAP